MRVEKSRNALGRNSEIEIRKCGGPDWARTSDPDAWLTDRDLGDPPIVKIDTPDQAREFVRKLAERKPDLVKIWSIVDKDHPVDAFRPIVRAAIEESHAHKIRVAVHATELETAPAAVEEGADVLVHSVIDKPVDDAFVKLLKDPQVICVRRW
jgi:hypothetical protein